MTATAHALVAGAIATKFSDPASAAILALTSHYIMDSVPHWDFGTNWRLRSKTATGTFAIAETLFGIAASWYFFGGSSQILPFLAAIAGALLPDWAEAPWYIFFATAKKKEPTKNAGMIEKTLFQAYKVQNRFHTKAQFPFGFITQVATVVFFLFLLK
ncbi:hypothetical protein HY948_00335 [Candidatus Gottesmanbacteria bacterium]|nr:hypothetical protein [Candidatus Gottesmanbacteria bacterium]